MLRRWLGTMAVAAVVAAGCVGAGMWQWHRHTVRSAGVEIVQRNYDAEPVALAELVTPGVPVDRADVWRPVLLRGQYLTEPVLLRNRPTQGQPALHVLAPFQVTDGPLSGSVLVVDRGWVPPGEDGAGARVLPEVPAGVLDLEVRLRALERPSGRSAPAGQVQAIAAQEVRGAAGAAGAWPDDATLLAYGAAVSEDGAALTGVAPLGVPSTDPGPHLSYAFQWWVFALGALVGGVVLLRRDGETEDGTTADGTTADDEAQQEQRAADRVPEAGSTHRVRRGRRPSAEEEEDALLDAQQHG